MKNKKTLSLIFSGVLASGFLTWNIATASETPVVQVETLSSELSLLTEEEKLAFDVYQALEQKWGHMTFSHISESEARHLNVMRGVLQAYSLADPTANLAPGQFKSESMQTLYQTLVNKGQTSLKNALEVGAEIEEKDIQDLMALHAKTDDEQLKQRLGNLTRASRNHLRAFTGSLTSLGFSYTPRHLSPAVYQGIINSPHERGGGHGNGHGKGHGNGHGNGWRHQ